MNLKSETYQLEYTPDTQEKPLGFYIKCLKNSIKYDRCAGYFTSRGLSVAAEGFSHFLQNDGKIRLICSHVIQNDDDYKIFLEYTKNEKREYFKNFLNNEIDEIENKLKKDRLNVLSWLLIENKIEIKIAIHRKLYHTKKGLFTDEDGNVVSFEGSNNETQGGWLDNYESLKVFTSWNKGKDYCIGDIKNFEEEWNNKKNNLEVIELNDAVKNEFIKLYKTTDTKPLDNDPIFERASEYFSKKPKLPKYIQEAGLRAYQDDAYKNWVKNDYKGIFDMATGTGKTISALNCALNIYNVEKSLICLILVPLKDLVAQWIEDIEEMNFESIIIASSQNATYHNDIMEGLNNFDEDSSSLFIVSTYATFHKEKFQSIVKVLPEQTLFIADEVHNFPTKRGIKNIPRKFNKRIGLSATYERQYDEAGNSILLDYYNESEHKPFVSTVKMDTAINLGFLCKYSYYPYIVYLSDEETKKYKNLSFQIITYLDGNGNLRKDKSKKEYEQLLINRSEILNRAVNKKSLIKEIIINNDLKNKKYMLVYVPKGKELNHSTNYNKNNYTSENFTINIDDQRLIDSYTKILTFEMNLNAHQYIGDYNPSKRKEILNNFTNGDINVLTAMKCLDEGINIKRAEVAIFCSSSGNKREFIQRRGRILRTHPEKKKSLIFDMIALPAENSLEPEILSFEKNMIKKQLRRVKNFAKLSDNYSEAVLSLQKIEEDYNIII